MRKLAGRFTAILVVVFLSACTAGTRAVVETPGDPPGMEQGIVGQSLIGPMCPVVREGIECPDNPYPATLVILDVDGRQVVRFDTDAQGRFQVSLEPGTYTLHPEPGPSIEHAADQQVTVVEGQFSQVTVSYDSGIR